MVVRDRNKSSLWDKTSLPRLPYIHRGNFGLFVSFCTAMIGLKGTLNVWQNVLVNARESDYFLI